MSHRPTKRHWQVLQERADKQYSLRVAMKDFLIAKAKLISEERKENEN